MFFAYEKLGEAMSGLTWPCTLSEPRGVRQDAVVGSTREKYWKKER